MCSDVQAGLLHALNTRIVGPRMPVNAAPIPAGRLNPGFEIGDAAYGMVTQFMAAIPRGVLRRAISNLAEQDDQIMAAPDMVLVGFGPWALGLGRARS